MLRFAQSHDEMTMEEKKPLVFTDRVRLVGNAVLEPIARVFAKLGIHPDVVTLIGLLLVMIACVFIARGEFLTGSLLLLLGLPFDALDGAVARVMQRKTRLARSLTQPLIGMRMVSSARPWPIISQCWTVSTSCCWLSSR